MIFTLIDFEVYIETRYEYLLTSGAWWLGQRTTGMAISPGAVYTTIALK